MHVTQGVVHEIPINGVHFGRRVGAGRRGCGMGRLLWQLWGWLQTLRRRDTSVRKGRWKGLGERTR